MKWHERPFKLRELKIEVTHKCPLVCIHCSSDATPVSITEIDQDICFQIIRDAAAIGAKELAFSGGEPLLWQPLEEALQIAVSEGLNVAVYTSGNVNDVEKRLRTLNSLGLSKAIFSVYGPDAKSHEEITRKAGSFLATQEAIMAAKAMELNAEIHFVVMSKNYKFLPQVARLAKEIGVSKVSVLRFVPQGRGFLVAGYMLNRLQNLELKRMIETLRKEDHSIRTGSPFNVLLLNDIPGCYSAIDRLIIGPNLRIYPCDAFKQISAEEVAGTPELSSLKDAALSDCWEFSPYLEAVRNFLTTDFKEPCKSCGAIERCLSGCLAQKVIAYGGLEKKPDPACLN